MSEDGDRALALLERIADSLADALRHLEAVERELVRANEQLADIRNALYS